MLQAIKLMPPCHRRLMTSCFKYYGLTIPKRNTVEAHKLMLQVVRAHDSMSQEIETQDLMLQTEQAHHSKPQEIWTKDSKTQEIWADGSKPQEIHAHNSMQKENVLMSPCHKK
jgi:hypothetical protein